MINFTSNKDMGTKGFFEMPWNKMTTPHPVIFAVAVFIFVAAWDFLYGSDQKLHLRNAIGFILFSIVWLSLGLNLIRNGYYKQAGSIVYKKDSPTTYYLFITFCFAVGGLFVLAGVHSFFCKPA